MKVTFTLTADERRLSMNEWLGLTRAASPPRPFIGPLIAVFLFLGVCALIAAQTSAFPQGRDIVDVVPGLIVCLVLTAIVSAGLRTKKRTQADTAKTISIDETGIKIEFNGDVKLIPWGDVDDIQLSQYAIIVMTESNFDHVIPRRAFPQAMEALWFFRAATTYWKPPPIAPPPVVDETVWPPPPNVNRPTN